MFSLLLFLFAGATLASSESQSKPFYQIEDFDSIFKDFIKRYDKKYENEAEKHMRLDIFKRSLHETNLKNLEDDGVLYDITPFADLTNDEFMKYYTGLMTSKKPSNCTYINGVEETHTAPDSFDWRDKNKVAPVGNQKHCGACWAFPTVGTLEGQHAIKTNELVALSVQELIDCDKLDYGCGGGYLENALIALKTMGAMADNDYPFTAKTGNCTYDPSKVRAKATGCNWYFKLNEDTLKDTLYKVGPLAIVIDAQSLPGNYKSGVIKICKFTRANHAALLVGYGTENGVPYWAFKNSWGSDWGEKGFFKVKRGVNSCGILETQIITAIIN